MKRRYAHARGNIQVYPGQYYQRGNGLGNILGSLGRIALPVLKNVGKTFLRTGVDALSNVVDDVVNNNVSPGESFKRRGREVLSQSVRGVKRKALNALSSSSGVTAKRRKVHKKKKKPVW